MAAMTTEKAGDCRTTACGADCPSGLVETYAVPCPGGGGSQRRCCSPGNYPDVLVFVDKGQGSALSKRAFDLPHADYSLLESYWTNARTVLALPGRNPCAGFARFRVQGLQPALRSRCCVGCLRLVLPGGVVLHEEHVISSSMQPGDPTLERSFRGHRDAAVEGIVIVCPSVTPAPQVGGGSRSRQSMKWTWPSQKPLQTS